MYDNNAPTLMHPTTPLAPLKYTTMLACNNPIPFIPLRTDTNYIN
jgi:hypothetical protein